MVNSFKTRENLNKGSKEYNRYYGNFRGVDFSNDHTQINLSRLAYAVNMYKDYRSKQGVALETIAGFRKRCYFAKVPTISSGKATGVFTETTEKEIYGIFYFKCKVSNEIQTRVLVHSGKKLYLWRNYPQSVNVPATAKITLPEPDSETEINNTTVKTFNVVLSFPCAAVIGLHRQTGEDVTLNVTGYASVTQTLTIVSSELAADEILDISYYENVSTVSDVLFSDMNQKKSQHFIFNNRLYILDGKNYLVYNGTTVSAVKNSAYIPTTYIGIIPAGVNANIGTEYEQRNILTPKFKHTFVADGETTKFCMNENNLTSVESVKVYGTEKTLTTDYTVNLTTGEITFTTAPASPESAGYEQGYAGVEITASKVYTSIDGVTDNMTDISELITKCTLCTTYDGRVFCTGNADYPNHVFFCGRNSTGYADPSYFGILNYMQDGVGLSPITGIMCVSDTLMVLKADTQQDSSIYFHTGTDSNQNLIPRIYPSIQGLSGLGCVGACCNFLDDPIFVSRLGVEGVSQLKISSERANEHRSYLIDAKLINSELKNCVLEEWGGYLCLLVDGNIFLADSRQKYADETGAIQYEWYYLEGIGVFDGQYKEYHYSNVLPAEFENITVTHDGEEYKIELASAVYFADADETKDLRGTIANPADDSGNESQQVYSQLITANFNDIETQVNILYTIHEVIDIYTNTVKEKHLYLCEDYGNYTGGVFKKASVLSSLDDNLFFGCINGVVCSFNFDQRNEDGELPPKTYNFDERTIFSGCATLMDNCQIPHLTKTTIKRSTVIKTKSFRNSSAKIKVRTNKTPYKQIARINSALFSFEDMDFSDFSFNTTEQSLFAVKEKEKQWVEKQYFIYSDEYLKPFALYYVSFRYRVAGRYKD